MSVLYFPSTKEPEQPSDFSPGDVQDTAPVPAQEPIGPACETTTDLPVQAVPLPVLHGYVPGESVEQLDVALVVDRLPVILGDVEHLEQPVRLDLLPLVLELAGTR